MTLRVKLILVSSVAVLILFGISKWLSYRYTTVLLEQYEAILVETADHTVALKRLSVAGTESSQFELALEAREECEDAKVRADRSSVSAWGAKPACVLTTFTQGA